VGHRLRAVPEAMALPRGARRALAACHRLVSRVATHLEAFTTRPLAPPPPLGRVEGLWGQMASPTGARSAAPRGRRRAVKRQQQRVGLRARGVWPAGHWAIVHGPRAMGATADTGNAFCGARSLPGRTETPPTWVGSDGSPGRESALDAHLSGVAHPRGLCHTLQPLAAPLVGGARAAPAVAGDAPATRKAKRRRNTAILVDASTVSQGPSAAASSAQADVCRETWHGQEPQAVAHCSLDCDTT